MVIRNPTINKILFCNYSYTVIFILYQNYLQKPILESSYEIVYFTSIGLDKSAKSASLNLPSDSIIFNNS